MELTTFINDLCNKVTETKRICKLAEKNQEEYIRLTHVNLPFL